MNHLNMQNLHSWLMQGAKDAVFDMTIGRTTIGTLIDLEGLTAEQQKEVETKGLGRCGTVCCIAGYAAGFSLNPYVDQVWEDVEAAALAHLGLPRNDDEYGNTLFNYNLAPIDCTPIQAARAVERVMRGDHPWPQDVTEDA